MSVFVLSIHWGIRRSWWRSLRCSAYGEWDARCVKVTELWLHCVFGLCLVVTFINFILSASVEEWIFWTQHEAYITWPNGKTSRRMKVPLINFPGEKTVTATNRLQREENPGLQDVFWKGWSESQLQPEWWPGDDGLTSGQKTLHDRLCGAVRGAGLHHDFWLLKQLHCPSALLQIQEAADAGEHAAVEHKCQRHAGVCFRHHTQLRV